MFSGVRTPTFEAMLTAPLRGIHPLPLDLARTKTHTPLHRQTLKPYRLHARNSEAESVDCRAAHGFVK
jgi:hypothetical protein